MRNLLWPLALLFSFVVFLRNQLFNLKFLRQKKLKTPVLCVGNISAGGTGKTPWVQMITQHFNQLGKSITILSRGYSGDFDGVLEVTPDMDPRKCGDEPLWLSKNTDAKVFVGRSRFAAAQKSLESGDPDLFILDDGFQHRKLWRDCDIVLLDASAPLRHYRPLPVGYLREGFSALKRAQVAVINKCNYADPQNKSWIENQCLRYLKKDRIFYSDFVFSHWEPLVESLQVDHSGQRISMSCGVGNPGAFLKTLEQQSIMPVKKFIFPDHYYWKPADIERMTYNMKREDSFHLMITEKDAVKLNRYKKHFEEMKIQVWICKMKVQLKEREQEFFQLLEGIQS